MEVFDLQDVVDEEQCEKLLEFAEQYSIFGKQDFLDALSRLQITGGSHLRSLRSGNRRSIVLARKDPANYAVHGAVLVEYLVDLNCGIVCAISVVDRSEENGRVLMGMISTALDKYSKTCGNVGLNEVFSFTTRSTRFENQEDYQIVHMYLHDIGFRLVETDGSLHSSTHQQDYFLLVYRPDLVPDYQAEDGVCPGSVITEFVLGVSETLSLPSETLVKKDSTTCPQVIPVRSSFPWFGVSGPSPEDQVVVVGAGIAGLAAAASLSETGFNVVLVEAANYIGGRVKQVQPFPGFPPVDLGAEFIHGSNTITMKLAEENKWQVKPCHGCTAVDSCDDGCYLSKKIYFLGDSNPDVDAAYDAWEDIIATGRKHLALIGQLDQKNTLNCTQRVGSCAVHLGQDKGVVEREPQGLDKGQKPSCPDSAEDRTLLEILKMRNCSDDTVAVFDAKYAQTDGGCLDELGLHESTREEAAWQEADNYRLEGSYSVLVQHYLDKCKAVDKRLNWQVKEIIWKDSSTSYEDDGGSKQQITLKNQLGQILTAKYVIITVPLAILKERDINFIPDLPKAKKTAIQTIQMRGALKLVCRFTTRFWAEGLELVYVARGFLSQIWMFSRDPNEDGEQCHVIAGFQTAKLAEEKVDATEEEMLMGFLHQLDEMFGSEADPTPASDNFMAHTYYHWSRNRFVRGGYSCPTVRAYGMRHELAKPVESRLFFAGEATSSITCSATVHAAIETGIRAASEVCHVAGKYAEAKKLHDLLCGCLQTE